MDGTKVKHRLARLAQHSNRSLFIKFLQISRLWSPQTCHFLQRSPSMTSQLGRKYLMKWRRSADQTLSLRPLLPHIWRERERERENVTCWDREGRRFDYYWGWCWWSWCTTVPLYRGYLDLRSPLEITPLHWSVQWHAHHSNHNRNNNNQTEISSRYWTNVRWAEASLAW